MPLSDLWNVLYLLPIDWPIICFFTIFIQSTERNSIRTKRNKWSSWTKKAWHQNLLRWVIWTARIGCSLWFSVYILSSDSTWSRRSKHTSKKNERWCQYWFNSTFSLIARIPPFFSSIIFDEKLWKLKNLISMYTFYINRWEKQCQKIICGKNSRRAQAFYRIPQRCITSHGSSC